MALSILFPFPTSSLVRLPLKDLSHGNVARQSRCLAAIQTLEWPTQRRSANYQPTIWSNEFVQSLRSDYMGDIYTTRIKKLQDAARHLILEASGPLDQLNLIDNIQRLGLGHLFSMEIEEVLSTISTDNNDMGMADDVHGTALRFRLLRQHGYEVSQDVFSRFMDEMGHFKEGLCMDTKGTLSLYEASHLALEGEATLDEVKASTSRYLKGLTQAINPNLGRLVQHALELPLHWRMPRLEARWYIDEYERMEDMNPILLELAKLGFNMVQAIHQTDLRKTFRWWAKSGLRENLSFARDRMMEDFLWSVGLISEPQFGHCREVLTKIIQFILIIDDVYDIYGSLDELEIFTDAIERWDINAMVQLPQYMKMCFLALYNTVNEIAYNILKEQGLDIVPHLKKVWADYCKANLLEAKWYNSGYTPGLEEYLSNAWVTASGPIILFHVYFLMGENITKEALDCIGSYPNLIRCPSIIYRLTDDLETSANERERGDVPKSIQCHMHETGVSEDVAQEYIGGLINDTWKNINEDLDLVANSPFPKSLVGPSINLARMAHCMYQYGDGYGVPDQHTKDHIKSLLVQPIPLE
ncbi:alpha-terpineol synthase, chloroplastic-like [Magnolia sinica]|uniref:alpha-terpineol synthase, chloroplastic-like n=1 Tax=Magnolia sinica TaxID=86752 RepID=UPI002659DA03|nr:alpha-terpineol synthase, chloroplastic-like [Magnolia sinica]